MLNKTKLVALTLIVGAVTLSVGCNKQQEAEHNRYTAYGYYYIDGTVITDDGNEWDYMTDSISNHEPYDGMAVMVGFDDNGTTDDITDDIILGLVWDKTTSIYDKLEDALSDKFKVDRNGNDLKISPKEVNK